MANILEDQVESFLSNKGFLVIKNKDWEDSKNYVDVFNLEGDMLLLKDVPFVNIYDSKSRTEFKVIIKSLNYEARIECKWQAESGSVDEKFPYMYMNACKYPEENVILIVDGGAYRQEALMWLKNVCENHTGQIIHKDIRVMNFSEFMVFIEKKIKNKYMIKAINRLSGKE